jgi:hypothetical protein
VTLAKRGFWGALPAAVLVTVVHPGARACAHVRVMLLCGNGKIWDFFFPIFAR